MACHRQLTQLSHRQDVDEPSHVSKLCAQRVGGPTIRLVNGTVEHSAGPLTPPA
jgi:hypothetical protein